MKRISIFILIISLIPGCDWNFSGNDEFDYNLKSSKVIEINNNFGLALFNEIISSDENGNIMISPASISLALGMAYNGAENSTKDAFETVFNYEGLTREEINTISQDLINTLIVNSKGNLLDIANSIWYREGFPVYESFIELNKMYYDASVKALDFSTQEALDEINSWVSEKTHNKIEKILDQLSAEEMMVLINALYFNCLWEYEFNPDDTRLEMFYNENQTEYGNVEMMHMEGTFNYASTDDFTAVELPYKNKKFSMHLFLPNYGSSVDDLIQKLDGDSWESWINNYKEQEDVQISLPKFKFEYNRSIGEDLKKMGLSEAFTPAADFSGISEISLMISRVIHKTFIDLNEEGTEAAAVTAVVMELTSMPINPVIRLDRPFLFAITENSSHSIVFIGKLSEPAYE